MAEKKICPGCDKEIAGDANPCPHCSLDLNDFGTFNRMFSTARKLEKAAEAEAEKKRKEDEEKNRPKKKKIGGLSFSNLGGSK